jgi:hypothetical protein
MPVSWIQNEHLTEVTSNNFSCILLFVHALRFYAFEKWILLTNSMFSEVPFI